eukprot:5667425-Pyramimonas_sp.AAC.1
MPSQRRCKKPRHQPPPCSRHHHGPASQRPGRPRQAQRAVPADLGTARSLLALKMGNSGTAGSAPGPAPAAAGPTSAASPSSCGSK